MRTSNKILMCLIILLAACDNNDINSVVFDQYHIGDTIDSKVMIDSRFGEVFSYGYYKYDHRIRFEMLDDRIFRMSIPNLSQKEYDSFIKYCKIDIDGKPSLFCGITAEGLKVESDLLVFEDSISKYEVTIWKNHEMCDSAYGILIENSFLQDSIFSFHIDEDPEYEFYLPNDRE